MTSVMPQSSPYELSALAAADFGSGNSFTLTHLLLSGLATIFLKVAVR
jgi:hypothetical protein